MRAWWLAVVCACKGSDPPKPAPVRAAPAAPAPRVTARLVRCAPAEIAPRGRRPSLVEQLDMQVGPDGVPASGRKAKPKPMTFPPEHIADVKVWTPYAAGEGIAPLDILAAAARDLEPAIRARMDKIDACFGEHTGSVRAMLTVAFDGGVISARTGGVGDHDVDVCIAGALIGLKVTAPPIISEVTCDLERGAPAPWRLTLDGRYEVIDASKSGEVVEPWTHAYAVIASPDLPAAALGKALSLVEYSQAALVAVRRDDGAPVFVGMAFDARTDKFGDGEPIAIDLRGGVHACADGNALEGAPVHALNEECASAPCGTLSIAFDGMVNVGQIAEQASAARAGGFSRIFVGGAGCQPLPGSGSGSASISGASGGSAAGGSAPSIASPSSR